MTDAVPRGLVPPQPNLGPEPWPSDEPVAAVVLAAVALALPVLAWFCWRLIRRRRARSGRSLVPRNQPDASPRGQFVALSDSIREALIRQFGTPWRAKTTEELSADSQLAHALGREPLQELIRFLDQVDQLKFAPERSNHHEESLRQELATWKPQVAELLKKIQAKRDGRFKPQGETSSLVNRTARTSVR